MILVATIILASRICSRAVANIVLHVATLIRTRPITTTYAGLKSLGHVFHAYAYPLVCRIIHAPIRHGTAGGSPSTTKPSAQEIPSPPQAERMSRSRARRLRRIRAEKALAEKEGRKPLHVNPTRQMKARRREEDRVRVCMEKCDELLATVRPLIDALSDMGSTGSVETISAAYAQENSER